MAALRLGTALVAAGLRLGSASVARVYLGPTLVYEAGGVAPSVAPSIVSAPYVTGTPTEGQTLTSNRGAWAGTAPIVFERQWLRNGAAITGATDTTYVLTAADVGKAISLRVTAVNVAGSVIATSAATDPIAAAPVVPPTILLPIGIATGLLHGLTRPIALAA